MDDIGMNRGAEEAVFESDARLRFPRGLLQPAEAFRFSCDALLLADFAAGLTLPPKASVADLGTGCGVVGLGLMLQRPDLPELRVVGVEREAALVDVSRINAVRLGLHGFISLEGDMEDIQVLRAARRALLPNKTSDFVEASAVAPEKKLGEKSGGAAEKSGVEELPLFDVVVCNPPWRLEGNGRVPPSPARRAALFGDASTFGLFFRAADRLLKPRGCMALVCGAERLDDALAALPDRLRPVRLRFVHSRSDAAAVFFLLEARKNSRAALVVEPPMFSEDEAGPSLRA